MGKRMALVIVAGLGWLFFSSAVPAADICSEPALTGQGSYRGAADPELDACVFKGIPFAQPPVGELRFQRPRPPARHEGVQDALAFGPACPQVEDITMGGSAESYSEDCLYLNVWRPKKSGVFPVLVWLYGGGFTGGAGSFDIYNGGNLAAREDVVVVTINYRLGALGYLALPELKAEDALGSTGNAGILDQIRALEWVRDNIGALGGDPQQVTVFGQSAGAMSVCVLLASPEAKGFFKRAMMMSGPCRLMTKLEDGYAKSRAFAETLGCRGPEILKCLRQKPTAVFVKKAPNDMMAGGTAWSPTVDGAVLSGMPVDLIQQGQYNHVPLLIGTTHDELRSYAMVIPGLGLWSRGTVNGLIKLLTGPNAPEVLALYDYREFRRPIDLAFAFGNQMAFDTPAFMLAEAISASEPVYWYRFDWAKTRFPHKIGAMHAIDVPFVFGAINADSQLMKLLASPKSVEAATPVAYTMMTYVANFAKTGNPNGEGLPPWPAYTPTNRERLYLDTQIAARPLTDQEIKRYRWFAARSLQDVLAGNLSRSLGGREK